MIVTCKPSMPRGPGQCAQYSCCGNTKLGLFPCSFHSSEKYVSSSKEQESPRVAKMLWIVVKK